MIKSGGTGGEDVLVEQRLYKRLKDMREDHDLSQAAVAKILQTNQQQISRWETGTQMMGVDKYVILAQYYNVSVDYLLGLIDKPKKLYE